MFFVETLPKLLLVSLALVMFGLGLSLTVGDFRRVALYPKAVAVALVLQVIALPLACLAIVLAFQLPPVFAIGLLLLAASPGGVSANLFSHLFKGNVALNISLTAINTVLSIVTMPLIANWAIAYFADSGQVVPLQFAKLAEVIAVVLIPVAIGMAVAARAPGFAQRTERYFKVFSGVVLAGFALLALVKEWTALTESLLTLGPAVLAFNLASLVGGYAVGRWVGLEQSLARAVSFEIGIHNSTLSLYIALSVLRSFELALPSAIYSVAMFITATAFGLWLERRGRKG